ncbi:MAG: gliding motility-associated C-terminal domain-containing protein [Prevotella sp.]|nr:gliding motility-associated C-terminal domain-containing protein [Prevotella sp.]
MKTFFKYVVPAVFMALFAMDMSAQIQPTIDPTATYTDSEGTETEIHAGESYSGSAPLLVHFAANPADADGWTSYYEWRFFQEGEENAPYLTRYEQDTEYTFTTAGAHRIVCYATFTQGTERIEYTQEYWTQETSPISISISESRLEMPNAFSPNGDGINDIYKAKSGYQSLVEFKATIFNRWGVKLFEWTDPAEGWDGTYKGKDVAQGVYFVLVKAKGADGRTFNIRRDVNLLRGYTESSGASTNE